jgi:hypothetical protein
MKAITLWQPWASLIMTGAKAIETRSRRTNVRGRIAIHAARKCTIEAMKLLETPAFQKGLLSILPKGMKRMILELLPRGAIIGTVEIVSCYRMDKWVFFDDGPAMLLEKGSCKEINGDELNFGNYEPGRYAWELKNPIMFDNPIPARGSQGFWNWEGDQNAEK